MDRLHLDLWWETREPAEADDARRLSDFVSGLPDFDPIYWSWLESPETKKATASVPLSEAGAKQLLIDTMARSDLDGAPAPEHGSNIWGGHAGPPPYDFRKSSYADTDCHLGATILPKDRVANHIFMRLSNLRPSVGRPWRASELRPLMKFARGIWNPAEMCAMFSFYILDLPSIPNPLWTAHQRSLRPWIGWITYLPPNLAARAKYPADVEVETLKDGAALVTLCEEPFDKNDAEGLARLHALEAALRPIQT
jgi:Immunity protein 52